MRGELNHHGMRGWPRTQDVETGRPLRSRIAQGLNVQGEYAWPLRSLRPCGTTSLNILVAWSCGGGYPMGFEVDLLHGVRGLPCYAQETPQAYYSASVIATPEHS